MENLNRRDKYLISNEIVRKPSTFKTVTNKFSTQKDILRNIPTENDTSQNTERHVKHENDSIENKEKHFCNVDNQICTQECAAKKESVVWNIKQGNDPDVVIPFKASNDQLRIYSIDVNSQTAKKPSTQLENGIKIEEIDNYSNRNELINENIEGEIVSETNFVGVENLTVKTVGLPNILNNYQTKLELAIEVLENKTKDVEIKCQCSSSEKDESKKFAEILNMKKEPEVRVRMSGSKKRRLKKALQAGLTYEQAIRKIMSSNKKEDQTVNCAKEPSAANRNTVQQNAVMETFEFQNENGKEFELFPSKLVREHTYGQLNQKSTTAKNKNGNKQEASAMEDMQFLNTKNYFNLEQHFLQNIKIEKDSYATALIKENNVGLVKSIAQCTATRKNILHVQKKIGPDVNALSKDNADERYDSKIKFDAGGNNTTGLPDAVKYTQKNLDYNVRTNRETIRSENSYSPKKVKKTRGQRRRIRRIMKAGLTRDEAVNMVMTSKSNKDNTITNKETTPRAPDEKNTTVTDQENTFSHVQQTTYPNKKEIQIKNGNELELGRSKHDQGTEIPIETNDEKTNKRFLENGQDAPSFKCTKISNSTTNILNENNPNRIDPQKTEPNKSEKIKSKKQLILREVQGLFPHSVHYTNQDVLTFVGVQNNLKTSNWNVADRRCEGTLLVLYMQVDNASWIKLAKTNGKIAYRFSQLNLNLAKENIEEAIPHISKTANKGSRNRNRYCKQNTASNNGAQKTHRRSKCAVSCENNEEL